MEKENTYPAGYATVAEDECDENEQLLEIVRPKTWSSFTCRREEEDIGSEFVGDMA